MYRMWNMQFQTHRRVRVFRLRSLRVFGISSGEMPPKMWARPRVRPSERVKLRSWLTNVRLTWHRYRRQTRFERSNRILAPELRGYVRRKVRHMRARKERERRRKRRNTSGGKKRKVRGARQKSRKCVYLRPRPNGNSHSLLSVEFLQTCPILVAKEMAHITKKKTDQPFGTRL